MLELLIAYRAEVQFYLGIATCLALLRWGQGPERATALVWLVWMEGADAAYHFLWNANYQLESVDLFHAVHDVVSFALLLLVAIYANRIYPLLIAAFQLLSVMAHLARELAEAITPIAYAVMVFAPSWGILIGMIVGFWRHLKRQREFGFYRSWRGIPPFFLDRLSPRPAG